VVASIDVPDAVDGSEERATHEVPFEFGPVTAQRIRFVIDEVRAVETVDDRTFDPVLLPVGIAELGVSGIPQAAVTGRPDDACRDDLVRVDDIPVAVRVSGDDALEGCDGPVTLGAGSHVVRSGVGLDTGIDVPEVVNLVFFKPVRSNNHPVLVSKISRYCG